ncbi:MAG: MFS transporter, partial [Sphingomonadales bacterium]|nr:MFS transporter [Sphingomonadales bacterium]
MDRADDKDWAGMSRLQIRVILICIAINMLDGFDILAIAFTAPAIAKEWSLNPEALGGLLSAGLAGMVAGSFLLGPLADRFGRRPIILFGLIIAILGMGGAALSQDLTQLALVRAITGFAVGGMLPCINTMVAEYASPKARTFSVAMLQAGFSTGASLGGFSAVWILASAGWQAVFLAGAVLTAILLPLVWFGMP